MKAYRDFGIDAESQHASSGDLETIKCLSLQGTIYKTGLKGRVDRQSRKAGSKGRVKRQAQKQRARLTSSMCHQCCGGSHRQSHIAGSHIVMGLPLLA